MGNELVNIGIVLNEIIANMYQATDHPDGVSGIASGFHQLDFVTSGWQNSDLIVIAGYPQMGKTGFMLSMALNICLDNKIPLALFTLQHSNEELVRRMLCNLGEIEEEKIVKGKLSDSEQEKLREYQEKLCNTPMCLYDAPNPSITELEEKIRWLVETEQIELVLIDYLQLIRIHKQKYENEEKDNMEIMRSLKILARELHIPIIVFIQLTPYIKEQSRFYGNSPKLSDFVELKCIQQFADVICFLHRPEYFKVVGDENGNFTLGKAELIVAKNHFGSCNVKLHSYLTLSKFSEGTI